MGVLLSYPKFRAVNDNGTALVAGKLYTYAAGTTTNKATYTDAAMTTANDSVITLDRRGEAIIYGSGLYKFVLKDSALNTIWTMDNVELVIDETLLTTVIVSTSLEFTANERQLIVGNLATDITLTLPAATGTGKVFEVKNINDGLVTVDADGAETIDGLTGHVLSKYDGVTVKDYAAGVWLIIDSIRTG